MLPQTSRKHEKLPEEIAVETLQAEIEAMNKECVLYNNPENYAKYGKLQRQLLKKEKDLKNLVEQAKTAFNKAEQEGTLVFTEEAPVVE
mgnify:CR=1 FL=1